MARRDSIGKPDYGRIADLEMEIYGEVFTVGPEFLRYSRCPHCKTVNLKRHAHHCRYKNIGG
jgi:hypothetical protein